MMRLKFNITLPRSELKDHLWLSLWINCCALYQDANLIFNIGKIMTMFSSSDNENENDNTMPAWLRHHQKWKDIYNWIRKINNQNRTHCKLCREEFEVGHAGEGDVETHMETESHTWDEIGKYFQINQKYFCLSKLHQ